MTYIVTFYSHFGAVRMRREIQRYGITGRVMPVPRDLSSSCGTCLSYESDDAWVPQDSFGEIEKVVLVTDEGYKTVYQAEDS